VSVAIKRKDKYLLVKEAKKEILGLWNFPSGKVNFGEDLFTAAKREAKEESGYDCKIMGLSSINFF
jgi:ADP-ribose pyrophosphatase YjhB (NUDIX family)